MTKEELKVMIDNTINSNGKRSITGKSLNLALSQIVECIGEEFNNREVEVKRNDVNFFDYDGTLLYSYSWEDARKLTNLPEAPSHEDMSFVGWNYTLEDIKAQGGILVSIDGSFWDTRTIKEMEIEGETYKCILEYGESSYEGEDVWIIITQGNFEKGSLCYWAGNNTGEWVIDKDDDGTPFDSYVEVAINYVGKVDVGACYEDFQGNAVSSPYSNVLIIPRGVEDIGSNNVSGVFTVVSIPNTVTLISSNAFSNAHFLNELKIPCNCYVADGYPAFMLCSISSYWHNFSFVMNNVITGTIGSPFYLQDGLMALEGTFSSILPCYVVVPNYIQYCGDDTFVFGSSNSGIVDFSLCDYIPHCESNTFEGGTIIIVPDALYDEWINETNWSAHADYIYKTSEYKLNIK